MAYELKKSTDGKYMFNLKAINGEVILTSEMYEQKDSALNGIESIKEHGKYDSSYETRTSDDNRYYFVFKAPNQEILGCSQMYTSPDGVRVGITSVQKNYDGPVMDATER